MVEVDNSMDIDSREYQRWYQVIVAPELVTAADEGDVMVLEPDPEGEVGQRGRGMEDGKGLAD